MLDDGATGLWWIEHFGGVAVMQDPLDTQVPAMPAAALEYVAVDHVAPARELGRLIVQLTGEAAEEEVRRRGRCGRDRSRRYPSRRLLRNAAVL
jgi:two-component system chemotaxis response regulator CheB